jgi:hypothetical protein
MKFPYGISDFREIVRKGYFYQDRTGRIPLLERGKYQLFIRPRRFGKSLLLSTLANYYDIAKAEEFESLFGELAIGRNPTPLHNQYFILRWDFSCVDSSGAVSEVKRALHDHVNGCLEGFLKYYAGFDIPAVALDPHNAIRSLESLISSVRQTGRPIFLLIDEYDNFANEILMGVQRENQARYEALVYEEGPLRTLFKAIKSATSESVFDRIFITGVSPVVMSDMTSGFNIAKDIYLTPAFNDLCGFTQAEVQTAAESAPAAIGLESDEMDGALEMMRTWYNGYRFSPEAGTPVYNPTLVLFFLDSLLETGRYPRNPLDSNLSMDAEKLEYISNIPKGGQLLLNLMRENHRVVISNPADRFGIREMLNDRSKDQTFMVSFLYYFGVLTIAGFTEAGEVALRVPNLAMKKLYVERLQLMLLPEPGERDDGKFAAKKLYQEGDMEPLRAFVEERFFPVFHNPDYRWANELTVKTAFLTLLYNDILYIMDSETELDRRYADLAMIVRPDMRRFNILDILIEFKFVSLKTAGLTGEQARNLTADELRRLPPMVREMRAAEQQLRDYGRTLEKRHPDLRLRKYAVVSLGFERIWCVEVEG